MQSKIRAILYKIGFYLLAFLTLGSSAVYAATTISTNISTGGTVTATNVVYANGNIDRSFYDTLTIGSTTSSAVTIGGTAALLESISLIPVATGTIVVGGTTQTGAMTFGRSTDSQTINIANGVVATTKTATINIGGGTTVGNTAITIGSASANSTLNLAAGDSGLMVNATTTILRGFVVAPTVAGATTTIGATGQTGAITLGQSTDTNTINIGNGAVATTKTQTINIGGGASVGNAAITIGSASGGSALTLTAGTGGLSITATTTISKAVTINNTLQAATTTIRNGHLVTTQTYSTTAVATQGHALGGTFNGNDIKGTVTTTPSGPAGGVEVTFAVAYSTPPVCVIIPAASTVGTTTADTVYVSSSATGMSINFDTAGVSQEAFVFNYHCMQ